MTFRGRVVDVHAIAGSSTVMEEATVEVLRVARGDVYEREVVAVSRGTVYRSDGRIGTFETMCGDGIRSITVAAGDEVWFTGLVDGGRIVASAHPDSAYAVGSPLRVPRPGPRPPGWPWWSYAVAVGGALVVVALAVRFVRRRDVALGAQPVG